MPAASQAVGVAGACGQESGRSRSESPSGQRSSPESGARAQAPDARRSRFHLAHCLTPAGRDISHPTTGIVVSQRAQQLQVEVIEHRRGTPSRNICRNISLPGVDILLQRSVQILRRASLPHQFRREQAHAGHLDAGETLRAQVDLLIRRRTAPPTTLESYARLRPAALDHHELRISSPASGGLPGLRAPARRPAPAVPGEPSPPRPTRR